MIKAVVFDFFGVICGKGIWRIYELAGGDLVKDAEYLDDLVSKEAINAVTDEEFHAGLAKGVGMTLQEWREFHDAHDGPNLDTLELVSQLKTDFKTAILSNASQGTIQNKLNEQQLALFDAVVVSGDVGFAKPDPQIYYYAAEQLGVKTDECIFIDDHAEYLEVQRRWRCTRFCLKILIKSGSS